MGEVLCVRSGCARSCCLRRGRVCNAAPPMCVVTVLTSMLGAQCSGVCRCGAVYSDVCVAYSLIAVSGTVLVASVCCRVAVLMGVWHCAS